MSRWRLLGLLWVVCLVVQAAPRSVIGVISDRENRPLPGATVQVEELPSVGAVANAEGFYELQLPDDRTFTLRVSYLGYREGNGRVRQGGNQTLNFCLEEHDTWLDQVVVTGTRTPKLLKDVPIVTRVISEKEIQRVDATHIDELLQAELPGIEFSYSMNQQQSLNMAGFGGNAVLFLVDGERLAGETLDNVDYSRLTMDNVQRIEIVKGAASSLYGSNAIGGVVNLISRESQEPWSVRLQGRYGAHNEQRYGGSVGFRQGLFQSATHLQYTSIDAIDLSKGTDLEEVGDYQTIYGNSTIQVKERLIFTPSEAWKLTARGAFYFRERNSSEVQKDRYRSYTAGLKSNYSWSKADDLELSYAFDQYDKADYLVLNDREVRDYRNAQHTVRGLYNHTFADRHILTVGGDYLHDYLMSYQFADNGHRSQHTADAFAQFDWNPHPRFNVIAGLRFDYFSAADLAHVSPKVGCMYKVGPCSLRASYAGGFRAPTLKEMYMDFYMGNIFMIYGNPDLKPESSHNFSLSAEYLKGKHNLTVTAFCNRVKHRIATAWNQELNGQVYTNLSPMSVTGVDVHASGNYASGWSWRLSYVYTYERLKRGEPLLKSTRPHTATARLAYDRDWKRYGLSAALTGRFLSALSTDVYTSNTSYEETERRHYPGYTLWKLSLAQRIGSGLHLTVAVDNLFNYRPSYYYSNAPTTTGTTCSVGLSLELEKWFGR